MQVIHEVLRPPHHLRRRNALLTRRALGAEPPADKQWSDQRPPEVFGQCSSTSNSLEEVVFAVDAVASAEALFRQLGLTVAAFQAFAVPVSIQNLQDEPIHDVLITARAHWDIWETRARLILPNAVVSLSFPRKKKK